MTNWTNAGRPEGSDRQGSRPVLFRDPLLFAFSLLARDCLRVENYLRRGEKHSYRVIHSFPFCAARHLRRREGFHKIDNSIILV